MRYVNERSDLMKFWDDSKNPADPSTVSLRSSDIVHWRCRVCGFEWSTTVLGRSHTKGGLCPCHDICRYIKQGVNDVLTVHPELALDFHADLNPGINIGNEGVGSHTKIHWKCHKCSYEWVGSIYSRVFHGGEDSVTGRCPACVNNRHVTSYGDLYPRLEGLYSKTNKRPLKDVTRSTKEKLQWVCEKHGIFESTIHSMIRSVKNNNTGCPFCHGNKVKKEESFGFCHPDLIVDWSQKNKISPYEVSLGSHMLVTWECHVCGNEWKAQVFDRHRGREECKVCYPFGKNKGARFVDRFPEAVKYYSANNTKPIETYSLTSADQVLWRCENGHEFFDSIYNYYQRGCFKCNICKPKIIVNGKNDFLTWYPRLAKWYDNEKNKKGPGEISYKSTSESTWWKCPAKKHSFQRSVLKMVKDETCPVCAGWVVKQGVNDLFTSYPQIKKIWDYSKAPEGPEACFDKTVMYIPLRCEKGHQFKATIKRMQKYDFQCLVCINKILVPEVNSIKAVAPDLAEEWSPQNDVSPDQVLYTLAKKRYWRCPVCNGDYKAIPSKRHVGDNSCPYCNNIAVLPGFNDVATIYPGLVPEWSKTNNIPPSKAGAFQHVPRQWTCLRCQSIFWGTVNEKTHGIKRCGFCSNRRTLTGLNDLASNAPEMLDEWSPSNKKPPEKTNFYLRAPCTWKCRKCNKKYGMPIQIKKALGDEACPYCSGKRVLSGVNDLATTDPDLAKKWSPDNKLPARMVKRDYVGEYLWRCEKCNQNYAATIKKQKLGKTKCPYCENTLLLSGYNDLKTVYPELVGSWSHKNARKPNYVLSTSLRNWFWDCPECQDNYKATIKEQLNQKDICPYCAGQKVITGANDLATVYPELVGSWSHKNVQTPDKVLSTSMKKWIWDCSVCHGSYKATIKDHLDRKDSCPYCAWRKVIVGVNDLATVYPELIGRWSHKNAQTPDKVLSTSIKKWIWDCPECQDDYKATIKDQLDRKDICPYCAGQKVITGANDLATVYPELVGSWSHKNVQTPDKVLSTSMKKWIWDCSVCHGEYIAMIKDRLNKNDVCPYCAGRKLLPGVNSLDITHPDLMREWMNAANLLLGIVPYRVLHKDITKVWWECPECKYQYMQQVNIKCEKVFRHMTSCPKCAGRRRRSIHFI